MDARPPRREEILIAEDSATQARRLQHMLEQDGYRVTHAPSGPLALAAARERKPALLISDVVMPEMDGYELCRRMKADPTLGDVPVILVTTLSDPGDVIRGLECRADNFILKPYDDRYLLSRVQFVLMNRVMRQTEQGGLAVEIYFNGQRHVITADRLQILNLLLSTYEAAIQRNKELSRAKEELTAHGVVLAEREGELREAHGFLEHLIAASPSMILRLTQAGDGHFVVTYISPNVGWVLGYGTEEVVGVANFLSDIIHPDDRAAAAATFRAALETVTAQIEQEYRWRAKDDSYRWLLVMTRVEYDEQGKPGAILCHALDITARKQAEAQRDQFFSLSLDILAIAGMDGRFKRINPSFSQIVGHSTEELLARPLLDFVHPDDRAATIAEVEKLSTGTPTIQFENRYRCLDGSWRWLSWKVQPLPEEGLMYAIARDVTREREDAEALAAAKQEAERANHAKSDFLSRMSHDLRTPLNAILGFAQLLEMDNAGEEQQESIRHILKGGSHLLDLINEVLDLARIEAGHLSLSPEPIPVTETVQHTVDLIGPLAARRGITIDSSGLSPGDRHVRGDRQRLNQILMNFLSNAVKYNREGGRLIVACEDRPDRRLRISVTDTGAGIPPEKLALLFQPFERLGAEQTAVEGTGLGLVLAKALAEAMNGALGVESTVDRGSTFWLELPISDVEPAALRPAAGRAGPVSADSSAVAGAVLYIEDNPSNLRLMERVLARRAGVRLSGAPNGQAGIDVVKADPPDLILLDLHLPDMPGEEVLRRLREDPASRRIPVAVLSADATPAQSRRLLAAGATAYLTKPLNVEKVLQLLDARLGNGSGGMPADETPA